MDQVQCPAERLIGHVPSPNDHLQQQPAAVYALGSWKSSHALGP